MLRNANAFLSSLVAGVIVLAVFFFIMPWLLLVLAVMGILAAISVLFGRGRINITTIRIKSTLNGNLIQTVKTVSSNYERDTSGVGELRERSQEADIIIYPDGSIPEVVPKEDS
jgi:ABC-type bacteriocin/lantibiotic exporter with double-glycine peptidase domain